MLLSIRNSGQIVEKKKTVRLHDFGLDERGFQRILFQSLDRLLPDDELVLLMESRRWREEPDLMAVGRDGRLFIFELKVWESQSENILQVLRYGQLFGSSSYDDLNSIYKRSAIDSPQNLSEVHKAKFEIDLKVEDYNRKQVFIVMTNGLDYRTREAIKYWRSTGLDVRPWVYRIYNGNEGEALLELSPFRVEDNPYEDIAEGYYILNTNINNSEEDHADMLQNGKAAAYFSPWKLKIERLNRGDVVFLYQSRVGIVAYGEVDGNLRKSNYHGNPEHSEEEYSMRLNRFHRLETPMSAAEIKEETGVEYVFRSTMFGLDDENGRKIKTYIEQNNLRPS